MEWDSCLVSSASLCDFGTCVFLHACLASSCLSPLRARLIVRIRPSTYSFLIICILLPPSCYFLVFRSSFSVYLCNPDSLRLCNLHLSLCTHSPWLPLQCTPITLPLFLPIILDSPQRLIIFTVQLYRHKVHIQCPLLESLVVGVAVTL